MTYLKDYKRDESQGHRLLNPASRRLQTKEAENDSSASFTLFIPSNIIFLRNRHREYRLEPTGSTQRKDQTYFINKYLTVFDKKKRI